MTLLIVSLLFSVSSIIPLFVIFSLKKKIEVLIEKIETFTKSTETKSVTKDYDIVQRLADDAVRYAEQKAKVANQRGQPVWSAHDRRESAIGFMEAQAKTQNLNLDASTISRAIESAVKRMNG